MILHVLFYVEIIMKLLDINVFSSCDTRLVRSYTPGHTSGPNAIMSLLSILYACQ